jgi:hypothetical protein
MSEAVLNAYWDKLVEACGVEDSMNTPEGKKPMCRVTKRSLEDFLNFALKERIAE